MSTARLAARVDDVRVLGAGRLHHHALAFDKPGRDGTGKANVRPAAGAVVHGVVWEIEASVLAVLDRFEPGYERQALEVHVPDARAVTAWTYLYAGPVQSLAPSPAYIDHVIAGALEHGLPGELVGWLKRLRVDAER